MRRVSANKNVLSIILAD